MKARFSLVVLFRRNPNPCIADSVRVRLTSGATVLADTTLRAFPRGEMRTVTRSWTAGAGVTPFTLTADPDSPYRGRRAFETSAGWRLIRSQSNSMPAIR
jgi:hypothetical protein